MTPIRVRVNPHNDLLSLATYHVVALRRAQAVDDHVSAAMECMSAVISMAFSVEAIINFVGLTKLGNAWKEDAGYRQKVKALEAKLGKFYKIDQEPYITIEVLKTARNALAHGKPMNFSLELADFNDIPVS